MKVSQRSSIGSNFSQIVMLERQNVMLSNANA